MNAFFVDCTGQVEKAEVFSAVYNQARHIIGTIVIPMQFGALDGLYCRYGFHFGADWSIMAVSDVAMRLVIASLPASLLVSCRTS